MKYLIKHNINKALKAIHNQILKIGIDISFVKKERYISALHHNSLENVNLMYTSSEHLFNVSCKEHQQFFILLISLLKKSDVDLTNKRVADVGCGIGNLLAHLQGNYKFSEGVGYDFSTTAIAYARKHHPGLSFMEHDIYQPFSRKFDVIFCTEVLEHLLHPEIALSNLMAALEEKGIIVITVPDGRKDTWTGHINFWSPESWDIFLRSNIKNCEILLGFITNGNLYAIVKK